MARRRCARFVGRAVKAQESPRPAACGENTPTLDTKAQRKCGASASTADDLRKRLHRRHPAQAPPPQSALLHHARGKLFHPTLRAPNSLHLTTLLPSEGGRNPSGTTNFQGKTYSMHAIREKLKTDNQGCLFKWNETDEVAYHKCNPLQNEHGAEELLQQQNHSPHFCTILDIKIWNKYPWMH